MAFPEMIFFLGKGGVGKSTLSAAAALSLAGSGRSTRLISLDPAHNLGDLFGNRKRRFSPVKGLDVEEIDPAAWTDGYLREVRDEARSRFRYWSTLGLDLDRMIGMLGESPGVEEYALLRALHAESEQVREGGVLVVDTPPTALALRILTLASSLRRWSGRLAGLRKRILKERFSLDRISGGRVPIAGYEEHEDPVSVRLADLGSRYAAFDTALRSSRSRVYVVTTPEHLAAAEASRIIGTLDGAGIRTAGLICNRFAGKSPEQGPRPDHFIPEGVPPADVEALRSLPVGFVLEGIL